MLEIRGTGAANPVEPSQRERPIASSNHPARVRRRKRGAHEAPRCQCDVMRSYLTEPPIVREATNHWPPTFLNSHVYVMGICGVTCSAAIDAESAVSTGVPML